MRSVLLLSVALLLVVVGVKYDEKLSGTSSLLQSKEKTSLAQSVSVFSHGWNLAPPRNGRRIVYMGFLVDSVRYAMNARDASLAILELPAKGGVSEAEYFDLQGKLEDGVRLVKYLSQVEQGSVLLMGSNLSISPSSHLPPIYAEGLSNLLQNIGAKSAPTAEDVVSFAFICLRTEDGYKPLAESSSRTTGVRLSYLVPTDRESLRDVEPTHFVDDRRTLHIATTDISSEDFSPISDYNLAGQRFDCIQAQVTAHSSPIGKWDLSEAVADLGRQRPSLFTAKVSMDWQPDNKLVGVRLSLYLDGRSISQRVVLRSGGEASRWVQWETPIPSEFQQFNELAIAADWIGEGDGETLVRVGTPQLISGRVISQ